MDGRFALVLVLGAGGCRHETVLPSRAPAVTVIALAPRAIEPRITIAGVLAPLPGKDVKVGALVSGRVDRVLVAEGDAVTIGQPLAHVEAQPLREHLSETEAQKEQARAALENARTRL